MDADACRCGCLILEAEALEDRAEAAIGLCSCCCGVSLCWPCPCSCPGSSRTSVPPPASVRSPLVVAITNSPATPPPSLFILTNSGSSPSLKFTSKPVPQPSANATVALNSLKLNVNLASSSTAYSLKSSVAIFTSVAIHFLIPPPAPVVVCVGISSSLLRAMQELGAQWSVISPDREEEEEEGERK